MTDKLTGVSVESKRLRRKYKATIRIDGKLKHLGYHATQEAAHEAFLKAKAEHLASKAPINTPEST